MKKRLVLLLALGLAKDAKACPWRRRRGAAAPIEAEPEI